MVRRGQALKHLETPSLAHLPLPGQAFLQTVMPFPAVLRGRTVHYCKAQGFKALDHFGLALNGGLSARAQGCSRRTSRRHLTPY